MPGHTRNQKILKHLVSAHNTILFLYTRLPDYFYRSVQHFVATYGYKAVIIRYKEDANTKYSFAEDQNIQLIYKDETDLAPFIKKLQPAAIFLSGWSDKTYIRLAKEYLRIPVVLAMDNPWTGSLKQRILTSVSHFAIHNFCNCAWVPGSSQYEYARRLGFDKSKIYQELYCADTDKFYDIQNNGLGFKKGDYPRQMVFVGRMVEYKQPQILAKVFNEVVAEGNYNWKLVLAGEGPLKETIRTRNYEHVQIMDFLDPAALPEFYGRSGAFCLPSKGEHWGVAVHEAAAAGLPLLLSDTVDSASEFLIDGYNGYSFHTGDDHSLKNGLRNLFRMSDDQLVKMGSNSIYLSKRIHHKSWSAILNSIVKRADG
jgi:glycosyltransferase involved in cell wall biosynthesis